MNNSEYWRMRVEQLGKSQILNEAIYIDLLKQEYDKALKEIKKEAQSWFIRFAVNNQITLQEAKQWLNANELKELKWDVQEYIKYGQENGLNLIWQKELENASAKVHISRLEALQLQIQYELEKLSYNEQITTQDFILDTYRDTYYKLAYELQKGHNVAFNIAPLDTDTLKNIISKPWTTDNLTFSDRIWKNKQSLIDTLQKDLAQSIIKGEGPDKIIENISKDFNVSKNRAATLVQTESAFFGSVARKKCFKDLWVQKYENVATLDSHTSEICQTIDGTVFDMNDYQEGTTAPPFHVRCRTTTAPYFEDEFEFGERAARNTNGKTYYVPSNIKYKEWKEKYVTNNNNNDIINANVPNFKKSLVKGQENIYNYKELNQIAQETNILANKYTNNESKWSGKIIQSNRKITAKLWNCNIEVEANTSPHAILHEQLHAHSISYYNRETYKKYTNIEEATIEIFTKEIGKKENIINIKSDYDEMVDNLRKINNKIHIKNNDFEFAQELFNIPVNKRIDFLENKIQEYLADKTINEAIEINKLMEVLYD